MALMQVHIISMNSETWVLSFNQLTTLTSIQVRWCTLRGIARSLAYMVYVTWYRPIACLSPFLIATLWLNRSFNPSQAVSLAICCLHMNTTQSINLGLDLLWKVHATRLTRRKNLDFCTRWVFVEVLWCLFWGSIYFVRTNMFLKSTTSQNTFYY